MNSPWLPLIIFTPWVGALLLALWRGAYARAGRAVALAGSLSTLLLAVGLLASGGFDPANPRMQLETQQAWIPELHVRYHVGLDGLSLLLVLLTGVVAPMALLASWRDPGTRNARAFDALFLFLQGSALGVFLALDFFLWFVFWELSLVPAFFLIKLWGGAERTRAAYQFVIYTLGGSAFLLLGFAAIYATTGTLDFLDLATLGASGQLAAQLGSALTTAVFLGVLLGFAVKAPLFPFHTWLPSTYAAAPTGIAMFLTAVMSKMGVYGFFRVLWPLFPEKTGDAANVLLVLAVGGVVLGAYAAMRQQDLKRMLAYSSLNHVSYCLVALFAVAATPAAPTATLAGVAALDGALLQIFNHGISAAALFYFVGVLEYRAGGLRGVDDFGGVRSAAPVFAGLCGIAMFSSLGLPGLNGFIGEFLVFRGAFGLAPWSAAVSCLGLLATAVFLLTFYQRVFHGPVRGATASGFADLTRGEIAIALPAIALMVLLGIWPQALLELVNPLVTAWTEVVP